MVAVFLTPEQRKLWLSDGDVKPGFVREAITADILEKLHQESAKASINKNSSRFYRRVTRRRVKKYINNIDDLHLALTKYNIATVYILDIFRT